MFARELRELGRTFFLEQDRLRGGPLDTLCAPGYSARIGGAPPMDLIAHQRFAAMFYRAFPDLHHAIEQVIAGDDAVAVEFTLYGTHGEEFMGLAPTRRPIAVSAIALLRCANGQVTQLRGIFDHSSLMQQLENGRGQGEG